jgi:hypothetical protein
MNNNHSLTQCPHCQAQLVIMPGSQVHGGWRQLPVMQQTAAGAFPEPAVTTGDWQRVTPIGRLEPRDITTAIYDAGVSFGLVTIAAGFTVVLLDVYDCCGDLQAHWTRDWWLAPAAGLAVALFRYFDGVGLAKSLLEIVETLVSRDIDGDGQVGQPQPPPQTVRVEMRHNDPAGQRWQIADLDLDPAKLRALAAAVVAGQSFAERTASAAGLTQDEFGRLRDKLIAQRWAVWNHPTRRQNGVTLTLSGQSLFRTIAHTPLPRSDPWPASNGHGRTQQHAARDWDFIEEDR